MRNLKRCALVPLRAKALPINPIHAEADPLPNRSRAIALARGGGIKERIILALLAEQWTHDMPIWDWCHRIAMLAAYDDLHLQMPGKLYLVSNWRAAKRAYFARLSRKP